MKQKLLALALLICSLSGCQDHKQVSHDYGSRLTVYCVNDVHGQLEDKSDKGYIGLTKLNSYIKSAENYIPEMTVMLAAGDMYQGGGVSNLTQGFAMTDAMNAMNFDCMTLGNHEFDWSMDVFKKNQKRSNFPIVSYDIYDKKNEKPLSYIDPYAILDKGGYRIGVIGEIGKLESSIASSMVADYVFKPDIEDVNSIAQTLKEKKKCDLVFLLTHNGPQSTYRKVDNNYVDAIFGGHTHDIVNRTFNGVPYLQAGRSTSAVTKLTYDFQTKEMKYEVKSFTAEEIESLTPDPAVVSALEPHKTATSPILDEVIGEAEGLFTESLLGKLVGQAMFEFAVSKNVSPEKLVAVHNTQGVRDTLGSEGETSPITYGMIYDCFPFDNDLRLVQASGRTVANLTGTYKYHTFSSFDYADTYDVITISYLAESGSLAAADGGTRLTSEPVYCRDILKDFIKSTALIKATDYK